MGLKVVGMGRICKDLDIKTSKLGDVFLPFTIASRGTKKDDTSFTDCVAFGKMAENIGKYFKKGQGIMVVGTLNQKRWEYEGAMRSKHQITINSFEFPLQNKRVDDNPDNSTSDEWGSKDLNDIPDFKEKPEEEVPF